jgi:galactosylceramidase
MGSPIQINIDTTEGRVFEGIGGITSNGMSKLLMDYPRAQMEDIFNLLFKPRFGASLQHLKVEIGSDVNTSSGTEPSHMRSENDFDITRGYGLVIAKKAKEINPDIYLEALRWGTPRFITDNVKKYKYYLNFLRGARHTYGLEFDYLGPDVNEGPFDKDWATQTLRPGLDRDGFAHIKLVAADSNIDWEIAKIAAEDPKLHKALHALSIHYIQKSTPNALNSGKPLWLSEDLAPFRHSFKEVIDVALRITRMYAVGRMVKYEIHPLIEAEYGTVPFNHKGILTAVWPWTGHYRIEPGLWMIAHFTQFIAPGWIFIDSGCRCDDKSGYITLKRPGGNDYSIIIANKSEQKKEYSIMLPCELPVFHVWKTDNKESFVKCGSIKPIRNRFTFTVAPYSIYSLTTTTGQKKGRPSNPIPKKTCFELPYYEDFKSYSPVKLPKYTLDQGGAFEAENKNGEYFLCQKIKQDIKPYDWVYRSTPEPFTLFGSLEWANYKVRADVKLGMDAEYAMVCGRVNNTDKNGNPPQGYALYIRQGGKWELKMGTHLIQSGVLDNFNPDKWNTLELCFFKTQIFALINGVTVADATDDEISSGQAALGCSYHNVKFTNFALSPVKQDVKVSCKRYDDKAPEIIFSENWTDEDGDYNNFGRTLKKSNNEGAYLRLKFHGTGVSIIGKEGEDCGSADICLDGFLIGTIQPYTEQTAYRKSIFSCYNLPEEEHEIELIVTNRDASLKGKYIYIDAIEVI